MTSREKYILLKTVQENNILPITSVCNMNCQFCSHHQNPSIVEVYRFGHLDYKLVQELITYLPATGQVIVGESASKIIEGEPLLHPDFKKILTQLRCQWPDKKIKITTNGSFLSKSMVRFLDDLQPLELNISLNCANPEQRVFLMRDSQPESVFKGIDYLQNTRIDVNGSIVAMPHLLGWEQLEETIDLLCNYNCRTIRVFLPGFTQKASDQLKFSSRLISQLKQFIEEINRISKIPVILEPPFLSDLKCTIKGVIPQTSAARAGINIDDEIVKINDYSPVTRVDAFDRVVASKSPELTIVRNGQQQQLMLQKEKDAKPGFVLDYDFPLTTISSLEQIIYNINVSRVVVITSKLASNLIKKVAERVMNGNKNIKLKVIPVNNKFFGGSIMCSGLLVNRDIIAALEKENIDNYDLIVLPRIIYDIFGKDLTGKSYQELEHYFGIKVSLI